MSPLPTLMALAALLTPLSLTAASAGENAPRLTLEQLGRENLAPGGDFARGWDGYPSGNRLVQPAREDSGGVVKMESGAAFLAVTSRPIPVEGGAPYTLAFEVKQEEIHIGFDMGSQASLVWEKKAGGALTETLGTLDGSFDWDAATFSVTAPPEAKSVKIRLAKRGSPGTVSFRKVIFGKGVLEKTKEELSADDFIKDEASLRFLLTRLRDFFADKAHLPIPGAAQRQAGFTAKVGTGAEAIRQDAASRGFSPTPQARAAGVWNEMLKGNRGFRVAPSSPYHAQWQALHEEAENLEAAASQWIATENHVRLEAAMRAVFGGFSGYAVGVDFPLLKTPRDAPYLGRVAREASLALARNEEESVQLTLAALDGDLDAISLQLSGFKNSDGVSLPENLLSISRIDCVKTNPPQYYGGPAGWWPDVVFPARTVEKIAKGTKQSFWITVAADAATPPGDYRGSVVIRQGGEAMQTVSLQVKIWDLTLPKPGKFKVFGCFHPYMLKDFYHWKEIRPDIVAQWNRFIVKKRWNPTLYFSKAITPQGEALSAALDEGLNAINLIDASKFLTRDESRTYQWPTAEQEHAIETAARKARDTFVAAGGGKGTTLYISGFDEQHDHGQYPLMKHVFDLAKKAVPEAKIATSTTYPPLDGLTGTVNTWIPLLGSDSADLQRRREAGDELFFYCYAHPFRPFPNPSLIDYPGIDSRITFWLAAEKGYTGFFHYLMDGWAMNIPKEGAQGWPKTDWVPYARESFSSRNGEGYFLYPGPDGQPVSSVRFELIRDGIEDWELLEMLREGMAHAAKAGAKSPALENARAALADALKLVPDFDRCSTDMDALMAARTRIAEAVIAFAKEGR